MARKDPKPSHPHPADPQKRDMHTYLISGIQIGASLDELIDQLLLAVFASFNQSCTLVFPPEKYLGLAEIGAGYQFGKWDRLNMIRNRP